MSDETENETEAAPQALESVDAWVEKKVFRGITLPSGAVVDIILPDLPQLAVAGEIPNELLAVAGELQQSIEEKKSLDVKTLANVAGFSEYIIPHMLVQPEVSAEQVKNLPSGDKELLLAFASRQRDLDAVGHHLAGLEVLAKFREFRAFDLAAASLGG